MFGFKSHELVSPSQLPKIVQSLITSGEVSCTVEMKYLFGTLAFSLLLAVSFGGRDNLWKQRRRCQKTCGGFASFLTLRNFQADLKGDTDPEEHRSVETLFDEFCEQNKKWQDEYTMHLRSYLDAFHNADVEGRPLRTVCYTSQICRDFMRKKRLQSRKYGSEHGCKMCQQIMNIVRAAAEFANNTIDNAEQLTKSICEKYIESESMKEKCVSVIMKVNALTDIFGDKLSHLQVCKGIGMCGNASSDIMKTCIYDMKSVSPWDTAFSVARDLADVLTPKGTLSGAVKNIMSTAFFSQVGKCLWLVKSQMVGSNTRVARSVEDCPVCDKITESVLPSLSKQKEDISGSVAKLCKISTSSADKDKCGLIKHFADTLEHILPRWKSHSCGFFPCGSMFSKIYGATDKKKSKSCTLCQDISNMVMKYINYLDYTIDQIANQVDELCEKYSEEGQKEVCKEVTKILKNVTDDMEKRFKNFGICKDLKVC